MAFPSPYRLFSPTPQHFALARILFGFALLLGHAACGDDQARVDDSTTTDASPLVPDANFADAAICADIQAVVERTPPTVQLLVDQSNSMTFDFGTADRWNALYATLLGSRGIVERLQSNVRFGLSLYTSVDGFANGNRCPLVTSVGPALNNHSALNGVFRQSVPVNDTPTGESLDAVTAQLQQVTAPGPKIVIVATDGEPDSCADPDPQDKTEPEKSQGEQAARDLSVAAATRAFDAGIRVFVVSVGNDVGEAHLQDLANAGAGLDVRGPQNAPYYVALQPDDLVAAFETIVNNTVDCKFTLNGQVHQSRAVEGTVVLDGRRLEFGTDWALLDNKSFQLLGETCDSLRDGKNHEISASFPCGVIVID